MFEVVNPRLTTLRRGCIDSGGWKAAFKVFMLTGLTADRFALQVDLDDMGLRERPSSSNEFKKIFG